MDRKKFLKKGILGMGSIVGLPLAISCSEDDDNPFEDQCQLSPTEAAGPFPIKTPAEFVRENIVSDRIGVALMITLVIQNQSNGCTPMNDVNVDIWHCDKDGLYSEYGNNAWQQEDLTNVHFLRGRQKTNAMGQVSFISIYPGWYPGRAPHIHFEILDINENSIMVGQIAFDDLVSELVYQQNEYKGSADTTNIQDGVFANSLVGNMADSLTGNVQDGYTLHKTITV
ncbi:MAG: intradiol ring-cleavage dioxygenase [Reichenbachiella sp.]